MQKYSTLHKLRSLVWPFLVAASCHCQLHQATPATLETACREIADKEEIDSNDEHTEIDADTFQLSNGKHF